MMRPLDSSYLPACQVFILPWQEELTMFAAVRDNAEQYCEQIAYSQVE